MTTLIIHGDHITLAQALKVAGLAETGGQAKLLVREGEVSVNGERVEQPGRKLYPGDRFRLAESPEWTVQAPPDEPEASHG